MGKTDKVEEVGGGAYKLEEAESYESMEVEEVIMMLVMIVVLLLMANSAWVENCGSKYFSTSLQK